VRQRQEDQVGVGQHGRVGAREHQVAVGGQVGVDGGQGRAGLLVGGGRDQLQVGVGRDQAQQLAAGVPARPGDRDPDPHAVPPA
jgi:hypothetical protein